MAVPKKKKSLSWKHFKSNLKIKKYKNNNLNKYDYYKFIVYSYLFLK